MLTKKVSPPVVHVVKDSFALLLTSYWRGEQPLSGQFWLWGMGVGTLVGTINTYLAPLLWLHPLAAYQENLGLVAVLYYTWPLFTFYGFWLSFYVWHVVSIWRCAAREDVLGRWLARGFVSMVTLTYWPVHILYMLNY